MKSSRTKPLADRATGRRAKAGDKAHTPLPRYARLAGVAGGVVTLVGAAGLGAARADALPGPLPMSKDILADAAFLLSQLGLLGVAVCAAGMLLTAYRRLPRNADHSGPSN